LQPGKPLEQLVSIIVKHPVRCIHSDTLPILDTLPASPAHYAILHAPEDLSTKDTTAEFILTPICHLFGGFTVLLYHFTIFVSFSHWGSMQGMIRDV